MTQSPPTVTALIPVYNNEDTITPLLDSLAAQTVPADEVLILDDGSSDKTAELARAHPLSPRVLGLGANHGPSVARNEGVRRASSEVVLFLDSDVVADRDVVGRVKEHFLDETVMAVNGRMHPEPLNAESSAAWYKSLVEYAWSFFIPQWDDSSTCLNTRIGAIRREAFLETGGFDACYKKPCVEDHEFGIRFAACHPIHFDRKLTAWHHFSGFKSTVKNYWNRTQSLLQMLWGKDSTKLDKGGASSSSAREYIIGCLTALSLVLIPVIGFIPAVMLLLAFIFFSWKSLRFCLRKKGFLFYLYSLMLHMIYGVVITTAAGTAFLRYRMFKPRP